jgi:hypothetical protein
VCGHCNRPRIYDAAGIQCIFSRNKSTVNKQKAETFILLLEREFSAGTAANSEQKADEMHVTRQLLRMPMLYAALCLTKSFPTVA